MQSLSENSSINESEYIFLKVHLPRSTSLLLKSLYNRPSGDALILLAKKISKLTPHYKNIIILGDLNRNLLAEKSESYNISQIIHEESL